MDIAVLCPDQVEMLMEAGKDYVVLGEILYDSNVLVTRNDDSDIKIVGYMNEREEHLNTLKKYYGDSVEYVSMHPNALGYALESHKIDATLIDCVNYLKLDCKGISITNNEVTQEIIVKKDIINDVRIKKFIKVYNEELKKILDEGILETIVDDFEVEYKEEILQKWKALQVQFSYLNEIK